MRTSGNLVSKVACVFISVCMLALAACGGGGGGSTPPPPANVAPSITAQPQSKSVTVGQTATFSVTATGTAPLSYQWSKGTTAISGATGSTYTTPATIAADSGTTFTVTVSNTQGSVTSSAATLTVNTPPSITAQPQSKTVTAGQTATFSVTATGTTPFTYQWNKNSTAITGATSSTYTTPSTTAADNGASYTVTVTNVASSVTSNAATLTVNVPPAITTQPQNQTVTVGQTATFSVVASGTTPFSYQWRKGSTAITGAMGNSYTTPATTLADSGSTYSVTITNVAGNVTSNAATLTVNPVGAADVTITIDPATTLTISPYIYGVNEGTSGIPAGVTFNRQGGNRWTAYNWENNYSNAGSDYIYSNDQFLVQDLGYTTVPAEPVRAFIEANRTAGRASLVTFQLQGYASADASGAVNINDANRFTTRFKQVIYKKSTKDGTPFTLTPPTTDNYVYMDEFAWALDQKFLGSNMFAAANTIPTFISLDNEPDLWRTVDPNDPNSKGTHPEVQDNLISSADFITKSVNLATVLKDQFPGVTIFGPVNYGWNGIYSWQGETGAGFSLDTNYWFADKYLQAMKAADTGKRLLDVYDFHWYSEARDSNLNRIVGLTSSTLTDDQVQAIVQSPRSLWDSTYKENSWITDYHLKNGIYLLRRLKAKIATDYPGTKIAITEYENGGFNHIAGTIAQADNLGIFGAEGVFAANFWPPSGTYPYTMGAFRVYRGFDGATANFGDTSIKTTSSDTSKVAVYVSSDTTSAGRHVIVAINRSTASQNVQLNGLLFSGTAKTYRITASSAQTQVSGSNPVAPVLIGSESVSSSSWAITLPALSVTTIEVK